MKLKKIVCFGGGNAVPKVILEPLKKYPLQITSITSMNDDGGSTGQLRRDFGVLPPGDMRRHILAFSDAPVWKKQLWNFRFGNEEFEGGHKGHSFGNVFIAGVEKNLKKYDAVLKECCEFMMVDKKYKPLPATVAKVTLCAKLVSGETIVGESEIDIPKKHDAKIKIDRIFLKPNAKAYKEAILEIEKADVLVFGPGDLYSSLLPCFLPIGIKAAISKSKAKKILVSNVMNKNGETNDFTVADFARAVETYIAAELTFVLYNNVAIEREVLLKARQEDKSLLKAVEFDGSLDKHKYIGVNILKRGTVLHDAKKTGEIIWKLIG